MKPIYLTGFMGSGKTTVGSLLGEELDLPVIDTDHVIEETYGKRVAEIFAEDGEAVFRRYEAAILAELPTKNAVITTGGGLAVSADNRKFMLDHGFVIFLSCSLETIFERLKEDTSRPLFNQEKKKDMQKLYESRLPFYRDCHWVFETGECHPEEAAKRIAARLKRSELGYTGDKR
ncbi:shikimate kinase [Fictibacillus fluitans]|uniref:Shikimate kinase n=1 Tax=Fictibacillus fluitans TaxID=3058422 RepID=A0ABT8HX03_9BACL|nr:shikimate kinase [Fictibacillus sp. NE201]MDN4525300.1 shikimate kinase [Fictibacillus sp. NE201]